MLTCTDGWYMNYWCVAVACVLMAGTCVHSEMLGGLLAVPPRLRVDWDGGGWGWGMERPTSLEGL